MKREDTRLAELAHAIAALPNSRDPQYVYDALAGWFNQNMELATVAQTFHSEEYSRVQDKPDFRKFVATRAAASLGGEVVKRCGIVTVTKPPPPLIVVPQHLDSRMIEFRMQLYALKRPNLSANSENWIDDIPW